MEIKPLDFKVHRGLAHVLRLEGKTDEAQAEFERAIDLDPRDTAARNELGVVLLEQEKIRRIDPRIRGDLGHRSHNLAAEINLAIALTAAGRNDEAAAHYRRALEIDPQNGVARRNLDRLLRAEAEPASP